MIRAFGALAVTGLAIVTASPASAAPETAPDKCSFVLSTPQATILPGPGNATGVTATMEWKSCTGLSVPVISEVCLSPATSNGRCYVMNGWSVATAYFATQHPSGLFSVTGRGCYRVATASTLECDTAEQSATI